MFCSSRCSQPAGPNPDYEITALGFWRSQDLHQQLGITHFQTKGHVRRRIRKKESDAKAGKKEITLKINTILVFNVLKDIFGI